MKIRNAKVLVLASTILLLAAGCNNSQNTQTTQPTPTPQTQNQGAAPTVTPTATPTASAKARSVTYKGQDGKNALDLLKSKYTVETKHYSFGDLVTGINGLKADSTHFWEFYVNGKSSDVGAGSYTTKSSDTIEWKYSLITNSNQ